MAYTGQNWYNIVIDIQLFPLKQNNQSKLGFSLIEVLVTLFTMAVFLALYQAALHSISLTRNAKDQDLALKIANNEIEGLRATGYASLPGSGPFSDSQLSLLPSSSATINTSDFNDKTKQVTVVVSWLEPGSVAVHSVSLSTLITKIGGLP